MGDFSRWNESICRAHAIFDAGPAYYAQVQNIHPTHHSAKVDPYSLVKKLRKTAEIDQSYYDWADHEIYKFAKSIFF